MTSFKSERFTFFRQHGSEGIIDQNIFLLDSGQKTAYYFFPGNLYLYSGRLLHLFPDPLVGSIQIKQDLAALGEFQVFLNLFAEIFHILRGLLEGFQLLKAAEKDIGHECLARMQALLYVFAGKFLNKDDLKKVKGVISMTILGEMLVKDGLDQGIRQGEEKLGRLIQLLIQNSRSDEISRAVTDRQYQEALYQEFGL